MIIVHTDGGSRGNPGPAAIGVVLEKEGEKLHEISQYIGVTTNNVAEYSAIISALEYLATLPSSSVDAVEFRVDSLLVVSQLNGLYAVKHPEMKRLCLEARKKISTLPFPVKFIHVRREQNKRADELVNEALDKN